MTGISFASDSSSPFVPAALRLVRDFCGADLVPELDPARAVDLYHGNDDERPCSGRIPLVAAYDLDAVPLPGAEAVTAIRDKPPIAFPFDLFAAIRFWLADESNSRAPSEAFDEHDRLVWHQSAQERLGVREVPIVNRYLVLLQEWLVARFGLEPKTCVPRGKRCVVVLSHDVDRPFDPTDALRPIGHTVRSVVRSRKFAAVRYGAFGVAKALHARVRDPRGRHWIFDDLVREEARRGFRSTFFFAPTSRYSPAGDPFDVEYDLGWGGFRTVIPELLEQGAEVGLHIGYRARERPGQIAGEKAMLEEIAGRPVDGSRHHYWHMARPFWETLASHEAAGLRYDSSVGFDEGPGYRLGIAYPFRPWDPVRTRSIETLQIPSMAMDGAFFYGGGRTVDAALEHMERLLDELKATQGIAAIDWHQETSLPASRRFRAWGEAYLRILDLLAADKDVAVRTYDEVLDSLPPYRAE